MVILGLTGSIGMGKSTVSRTFQRLGVPVHDADKTVHKLLSENREVIQAIEAAFPGVVKNGGVDRQALANRVIGNNLDCNRLEGILHPLVRVSEKHFLFRAAMKKEPLVVLDIPLLFETNAEERCGAVVVASAPAFVQEARVLSRPGMTRERFEFFLSRQTSNAEKRRRADFIVETGLGLAFSLRTVKKIVKVAMQIGETNLSPEHIGRHT